MLMELSSSQRKVGANAPVVLAADPFTSSAHIQEVAGRYFSSVVNGEMFTMTTGLVAAPAGISPLAAGGTPMLALYNPLNSNYYALIRKLIGLTTATGTTSPKALAINTGFSANAITQTANIVGLSNFIGAPVDGIMKGFSAVALTGSSILSLFRGLNAIGNTAAQANLNSSGEDVNDEIIVPPGCVIAIVPMVAGVVNEHMAAIQYALRKI